MDDNQVDQALEMAIEAACDAGDLLLPHFGVAEAGAKSATGNPSADAVTALDLAAEEFLSQRLGTFSSEIGFFGEEHGARDNQRAQWLVDPIDGTGHFIRGLPFCSTMVALVEDGEVLVGVIRDFVNDRTYWARIGAGAYVDGKALHVSDRPLAGSMVALEARLDTPARLERFRQLGESCGVLIHTVNAGIEFAMVASGRIEGRICVEGFGGDWDYAAGSLLVREAGGLATNIGRSRYDYRNHDYVIANPAVHAGLTSGPDALFPVSDGA